MRVPDEVALVGYDETPWTSLVTPPLTVIFQPARALGRVSAEVLLGRITGSLAGDPIVRVLQPKLIVRASSGAPYDGASERYTADIESEMESNEAAGSELAIDSRSALLSPSREPGATGRL